MRVAIAGGHGQVALLLERRLVESRHEVVAIIRTPGQRDDVGATGATPVVLDLEQCGLRELARAVAGTDAVVFAAGAGPGSGSARKDTVDRASAVLLADAAEAAEVPRYVMVSAMGAERADPDSDDVFQTYLRAKAAADADLRSRTGLAWTVVRPGRLTNDPPTGRVELGPELDRGAISRADVAEVLLAVLESPSAERRQFDVVSGNVPVRDAVGALG